jgi:hypothetical protein
MARSPSALEWIEIGLHLLPFCDDEPEVGCQPRAVICEHFVQGSLGPFLRLQSPFSALGSLALLFLRLGLQLRRHHRPQHYVLSLNAEALPARKDDFAEEILQQARARSAALFNVFAPRALIPS